MSGEVYSEERIEDAVVDTMLMVNDQIKEGGEGSLTRVTTLVTEAVPVLCSVETFETEGVTGMVSNNNMFEIGDLPSLVAGIINRYPNRNFISNDDLSNLLVGEDGDIYIDPKLSGELMVRAVLQITDFLMNYLPRAKSMVRSRLGEVNLSQILAAASGHDPFIGAVLALNMKDMAIQSFTNSIFQSRSDFLKRLSIPKEPEDIKDMLNSAVQGQIIHRLQWGVRLEKVAQEAIDTIQEDTERVVTNLNGELEAELNGNSLTRAMFDSSNAQLRKLIAASELIIESRSDREGLEGRRELAISSLEINTKLAKLMGVEVAEV